MKASDVPKGLDLGVWPPPRLVGRIPASVSRADRYRLAVARVNFIGLLEQDRRLPSLFAATSKRLGLRPRRRGLGQQVKRNEGALWTEMNQIARILGLRWPWIAQEIQEALSRERRARMARIDQLLQESRALRALVDLKYEARLTTQGQILGAMRRGAL